MIPNAMYNSVGPRTMRCALALARRNALDRPARVDGNRSARVLAAPAKADDSIVLGPTCERIIRRVENENAAAVADELHKIVAHFRRPLPAVTEVVAVHNDYLVVGKSRVECRQRRRVCLCRARCNVDAETLCRLQNPPNQRRRALPIVIAESV